MGPEFSGGADEALESLSEAQRHIISERLPALDRADRGFLAEVGSLTHRPLPLERILELYQCVYSIAFDGPSSSNLREVLAQPDPGKTCSAHFLYERYASALHTALAERLVPRVRPPSSSPPPE